MISNASCPEPCRRDRDSLAFVLCVLAVFTAGALGIVAFDI